MKTYILYKRRLYSSGVAGYKTPWKKIATCISLKDARKVMKTNKRISYTKSYLYKIEKRYKDESLIVYNEDKFNDL